MDESDKAHKMNQISSNEPEVGVYWFLDGKIYYQASTPVSHGVSAGGFVNNEYSHYDIWNSLEDKGILAKDFPNNPRIEYDEVPRGRVVYKVDEDQYVIYHGDTFTDDEYTIILNAFKLPSDKTVHEIDFHYNPLPDDFDF
jgi:hypothetical protein